MLAEPDFETHAAAEAIGESSSKGGDATDVFQHFANASVHLQELAKLLRDIQAESPPISSRSADEASRQEAGDGLVPMLHLPCVKDMTASGGEPLDLETSCSFKTEGLLSMSDSLTLSASPTGVDEEACAAGTSAPPPAEETPAAGSGSALEGFEGAPPAPAEAALKAVPSADATLLPAKEAAESAGDEAGDHPGGAPPAPPEAMLKEASAEAVAPAEETAVDAAGGGSALEAFEGAPPGPAEAALKEVPSEADATLLPAKEAAESAGDEAGDHPEGAPPAPPQVGSEPSSIDRLGDKEKRALAAAHQTLTEMAKLLLEATLASPEPSPRPEATDDESSML
ncbi:dfa3 [Symbiodinium natans]|uniref:Dfa3 protein n=1 Tax=Symbiodinium natans TaxID=878477 RepID=A0A812IKV6_9DINO|nr:dfa3 [Symbiodinium natans]